MFDDVRLRMCLSGLVLAALMAVGLSTSGVSANSSTIVISEFRVRGPNGGNDEFVELYNVSSSPMNISGWKINGSNNAGTTSTRVTIAANTILNPGCHFLATNSSSTGGPYSGSVPGNQTYATSITDDGGIALLDASSAVVDQVGMSAGSAYKEGAPLASTGTANQNRSYERSPGGAAGSGTDSDNNANDFRLISPSDPQNLSSPCIALNGPTGVGSANPASVEIGGPTILQVVVTLGNPATSIASVIGDLTSIGGSSSQTFAASGPLTYSFTATVGDSAGSKTIPVTITEQAPTSRTGNTTIALSVAPRFHPIHDIQGSGSTSPLAGQAVRTQGMVTAVRFNNGFFIQAVGADVDADPATSEGIFVFTSAPAPADAAVGNLIEVAGTVQEFVPSADPNSPPSTEITSPTVTLMSTGNPLPEPITLTAADMNARGGIEQLERVEHMRVHIESLTVVSPTQGFVNEATATSTSNGAFYGVITGTARPFREAGVEVPDPLPSGAPPNVPRFDANPERLRVDSDGQVGATRLDLTSGAIVTNLTGVLDYNSRTYTLLPDASAPPSASGNILALPVPAPTPTQFTVASANLERFFDTTNDPGISDVALTPAAFDNRLNKASLMIRNVLRSPDIVGVEEMENLRTLQDLAAKINIDAVAAGAPDPQYVAYLTEGNDIGGIDVGFLVKSARVAVIDVAQEGKDTTYTEPNGSTAILNDRPSLVLRAAIGAPDDPTVSPARVTVIVNHLRSLSGIDDPAEGARIRLKRRTQAECLGKLIQNRQSADPSELIVSIGDYNAFQFNDGYVDVIGTIKGRPAPADQVVLASPDEVNPDLIDLVEQAPPADRYSFLFDGNAQELDHVLITSNMWPMSRGLFWGRTNADFPEAYRNDPNRPERISDHDPVVAYFDLPRATTTTVSVAPNPAVLNQPVTFTATVAAGAGEVDTGTVTFRDGAAALAVGVPVHDGRATATLFPAAGDHSITAVYTGAVLFASSVSDEAPLKIDVPVLSVPSDIVVEATGPSGAVVTFDAFASNDVEKVPAMCAPASGSTFAIATTTVGCSATDPYGNIVSGQFTVTVRDTTPPALTMLSVTPMVLWPPNHWMVPVTVSAVVSDLVDRAPACRIRSIASSEADDGLGDGDTAKDVSFRGLTAWLRAERAGAGPGRHYIIGVQCVDAAGNDTNASVKVIVPHSQGK